MKKLAYILITFMGLSGCTFDVPFMGGSSLSTDLVEVPSIIETKIGEENRAFYVNNNDPNDILEKVITDEQYESLRIKTPPEMEIEGYTFKEAYGKKPLIATSTPVLKDNEFYTISTTTNEVMIKLPGESVKKMKETDLLQKLDPVSFFRAKEAKAAVATDSFLKVYPAVAYTYTIAFTCSGSDRLLVVNLHQITDIITYVSYAGVQLSTTTKFSNIDSRYSYVFNLINPASGTNNIYIKQASSIWTPYMNFVSFNGANQTSFPATSTVKNDTTPSKKVQSLAITPPSDGNALLFFEYDNVGTATGTLRAMKTLGTNGTDIYISNPLLVSPAASTTMALTSSDTFYVTMMLYAIAPASGGGGTTVATATIRASMLDFDQ